MIGEKRLGELDNIVLAAKKPIRRIVLYDIKNKEENLYFLNEMLLDILAHKYHFSSEETFLEDAVQAAKKILSYAGCLK